jgi:hypothetical protein
MVISVTFGAVFLAGGITLPALLVLMGSNYVFKVVVALADTVPFYLLTIRLRNYLDIDNHKVFE